MNYNNYEIAIVNTYGVKLVDWPTCISFLNPSNIGTVSKMWKKLSRAECDTFTTNIDKHHTTGEEVQKPHKKQTKVMMY
ncbi:hypothetical protein HYDPIDRAFT_100632 [Hydnomerulius pinastri MD-312]|uniref:Uncharacterized protein n=1 Tax=Hydnomerulius pinastri MD-312 TaxID=994086 RepID=A0A0C9V2G7_9AGAM|nr:hypothetical protein HYDPIDRAFT_100632 [Hydnomerulius pinastri MD-312]